MKQIQYHTTLPLHKTIVTPNDNAVGNHWRKSVLGKSCHSKTQLGFRVGKKALQGGRRNPPSHKAWMYLTAMSALAGEQAQQMIHKPRICFNNACKEPLWLPLHKLHRFSCVSVRLIWFYQSDSSLHAKDNMLLKRIWFVKNITMHPWENHQNSPTPNVGDNGFLRINKASRRNDCYFLKWNVSSLNCIVHFILKITGHLRPVLQDLSGFALFGAYQLQLMANKTQHNTDSSAL